MIEIVGIVFVELDKVREVGNEDVGGGEAAEANGKDIPAPLDTRPFVVVWGSTTTERKIEKEEEPLLTFSPRGSW